MNVDEITRHTANSPADLMDLKERLETPLDGQEEFWVPNNWAFRGQPKKFGTLAPSFQREFINKRSVPAAHLIESKLIQAFRQHYAKLDRSPGMPEPMLIDAPNFDLRCLSVMQHYGVPTRLLDWTSDFWTAIYFACAGDPNEDGELWYYDRSIFDHQERWITKLGSLRNTNPNTVPEPEPEILSQRNRYLVFEFDPKMTPRMREQIAHHTVSTEVFADHAPSILRLFRDQAKPIAEQSGDAIRLSGLHRIIVAKGCKEKALRFLDEYNGITASSIFPDVEGLGRFLRWQLDSLLTTLL